MAKQELHLPDILIQSKKHSFGYLRHIIRPGATLQVIGSKEISISPRRSALALTLSNGETVIVSEKRTFERPPEIDGVLYQNPSGVLRWSSHKLIDAFLQRFASEDWAVLKTTIQESWKDSTRFSVEHRNHDGKIERKGLRPPQIGSLHSIGAHWSINTSPATIVMPTGTGKTEAMLATLANFVEGTLLIVVPSRALRDQTARKFGTFGLLRDLGCLLDSAMNPVVAVIDHRLKNPQEIEILKHCNVIIATINTVAQGEATELARQLASVCTHLIFDEAHHVPAETYSAFREIFKDKLILQFTATPFRRDGKQLDGKNIFSYPLGQAQKDGYFKPINFQGVFDLHEASADRSIANAALAKLEEDLNSGLDHLLMARCASAERARQVFKIYQDQGSRYNPVLVISDLPKDNKTSINKLKSRQTRVIVCVNMLGEGFDLPELKIAAVHDTHKSIAILLQFAGRFTREGTNKIGNATVFANIANQSVTSAMERLYGEDADWNKLLSEFSSQHVKDYTDMIDFIRDSQRIDMSESNEEGSFLITPNSMRPSFSVTAFRAESFSPERFFESIAKTVIIRGAWINHKKHALYFVTEQQLRTKWTAAKAVKDRQWDLFVLYFNERQKTLFVHSSDTDTPLIPLAISVGGDNVKALSGDIPFRCLASILRLMFQNIGLRKPGRRNLRYSMYSGSDVMNALTSAEKSTSVKANASAHGYENGVPLNIACSAKGKIWSKDRGRIPDLLKFCDSVGTKLNDDSIDVEKIIENVLIPKQVTELPNSQVFSVDWPLEFYSSSEESTRFSSTFGEFALSQYSLKFTDALNTKKHIQFDIQHETHQGRLELKLIENERGYEIRQIDGPRLSIRKGKLTLFLDDYFNDYPPSILYVDGSELDGCYHATPKDRATATFPSANLHAWNWTGVVLNVESMWHHGQARSNSIQEYVANFYKSDYAIVFDDDDAGEAADLVLIRESDTIELVLVHCKFSGALKPGERVKDVVEVATQAIRSSKRIWKFEELVSHLLKREAGQLGGRPSRFIKGNARRLADFKRSSKHKLIEAKIIIVQPGLSKQNITEDQSIVLAAAEAHILQTTGISLSVICSA